MLARDLRQNRSGYILMNVIGLVLISLTFAFAFSTVSSAQKDQRKTSEILIAQTFVSELLEYFASMTATQIESIYGSQQLCTYRNVLNRSSGSYFGSDTLANLPSNLLQNANNPANRYYRIDVIDVTTQTLRPCPSTTTVLTANRLKGEFFQFTVGVSWVSKTKGATIPLKYELSTISQL